MKKIRVLVSALLALCLILTACGSRTAMSYEKFKALDAEGQKAAFAAMSGQEVYDLVKASDENWPVTAYDLITPGNAKETIVLFDNGGEVHFNLAWPCYGGFLPESIVSLGDLSGTLDVSRDGGDGGYSMSAGRNEDGSYPNDAQRSVPKTSASVRVPALVPARVPAEARPARQSQAGR